MCAHAEASVLAPAALSAASLRCASISWLVGALVRYSILKLLRGHRRRTAVCRDWLAILSLPECWRRLDLPLQPGDNLHSVVFKQRQRPEHIRKCGPETMARRPAQVSARTQAAARLCSGGKHPSRPPFQQTTEQCPSCTPSSDRAHPRRHPSRVIWEQLSKRLTSASKDRRGK